MARSGARSLIKSDEHAAPTYGELGATMCMIAWSGPSAACCCSPSDLAAPRGAGTNHACFVADDGAGQHRIMAGADANLMQCLHIPCLPGPTQMCALHMHTVQRAAPGNSVMRP